MLDPRSDPLFDAVPVSYRVERIARTGLVMLAIRRPGGDELGEGLVLVASEAANLARLLQRAAAGGRGAPDAGRSRGRGGGLRPPR